MAQVIAEFARIQAFAVGLSSDELSDIQLPGFRVSRIA